MIPATKEQWIVLFNKERGAPQKAARCWNTGPVFRVVIRNMRTKTLADFEGSPTDDEPDDECLCATTELGCFEHFQRGDE